MFVLEKWIEGVSDSEREELNAILSDPDSFLHIHKDSE